MNGKHNQDARFWHRPEALSSLPPAFRAALGVASLWPALFFFGIWPPLRGRLHPGIGASHAGAPPPEFALLAVGLPVAVLLTLGLLSLYLRNVNHNPRVPAGSKELCVALLYYGNIVALPVYWYLFLWCGEDTAGSAQAAAPTALPVDGGPEASVPEVMPAGPSSAASQAASPGGIAGAGQPAQERRAPARRGDVHWLFRPALTLPMCAAGLYNAFISEWGLASAGLPWQMVVIRMGVAALLGIAFAVFVMSRAAGLTRVLRAASDALLRRDASEMRPVDAAFFITLGLPLILGATVSAGPSDFSLAPAAFAGYFVGAAVASAL